MLVNRARKYRGTRDDQHGDTQALTKTELEQLWSIIKKPRDKALLYLIYSHGLRAKEAACLKVKDVDFAKGRILVTAFKRKMDKNKELMDSNRPVFIEKLRPQEKAALEEYLASRPDRSEEEPLFLSQKGSHLSSVQIFRIFQKYAEAAGIDAAKCHTHALRHTLGYLCRKNGVSVWDTQKVLRHSGVETTNKYYYTMTLDEKLEMQEGMGGFL